VTNAPAYYRHVSIRLEISKLNNIWYLVLRNSLKNFKIFWPLVSFKKVDKESQFFKQFRALFRTWRKKLERFIIVVHLSSYSYNDPAYLTAISSLATISLKMNWIKFLSCKLDHFITVNFSRVTCTGLAYHKEPLNVLKD
jgi:hypothetical protein